MAVSPRALAISLAAAAGLLAACAAPAPQRPPPPEGVMAASARLAPPPAAEVTIALEGLPPGRRIEGIVLVAPDGARYPAALSAPVRTSEGGVTSGPRLGVGVRGGSSTGIRPSLSLGWNVSRGRSERTGRRIEAVAPIPDPAAYREEAARWRIEVVVTEVEGARRTLSFPAQ